ncbi:YwqG family protein [Saccharibacillus alkalitolerans]|uniref:DUF1963 domain-containing protein n=1 Tax=Saccharibacillus alkalitolerans TaxID=2705290 RepID=A0ABX0FDC6_9BACL|nr:YwqG family protein [Saccharibacillus alkalitolerans]NGZ77684.1 DUF1963 domain-containing protein [Saccharibacillus alkalitolerans]
MRKDENVLKMIEESGLDRIAGELKELTRLSNRIRTEAGDDDKPALGRSKIGGRPDLPGGTEWPLQGGRPLTFIAQIRLEDVPWKTDLLPQKGLLSFFYDAADQPWGYDPQHAGGWKVLYAADADLLQRRSAPEGTEHDGDFEPLNVEFSVQTTLPHWNTLAVRRMELTGDEIDLYIKLMEQITDHNAPGFPIHRLMGWPDQVQGEMQLECQLVTHGIYCGNPIGYRDPRRQELEPGAEGWKLLLQIDSEDDIGMTWGDFGMIYFWIREDDLAKGDFDKVWVVLQCG